MSIFNEYNVKRKVFGTNLALLSVLTKPKLNILPFNKKFKQYYNNEVLKFININYTYIINIYKLKVNKNEKIEENSNIWVFWWQGIDNAPDVVKRCIDNIIINKGNHRVIIISKYNYNDYIDIPNYILEKVGNGSITLTHFSDIIRTMLLADHGGIWIDATVFITKEFPKEIYNYSFYSNKIEVNNDEYISQGKWSAFFLCCSRKNLLACFTRDVLLAYWEQYDELITYFFIDYIIFTGYQYISGIHDYIDSVPYNNSNIYEFINNINKEYDKEKYIDITKDTWLFKLSWKHKYIKNTYDKKETFYKKMIDGEL